MPLDSFPIWNCYRNPGYQAGNFLWWQECIFDFPRDSPESWLLQSTKIQTSVSALRACQVSQFLARNLPEWQLGIISNMHSCQINFAKFMCVSTTHRVWRALVQSVFGCLREDPKYPVAKRISFPYTSCDALSSVLSIVQHVIHNTLWHAAMRNNSDSISFYHDSGPGRGWVLNNQIYLNK